FRFRRHLGLRGPSGELSAMAISTLCPGCKALFRLPDELAGKQVKCQKCGQRFMVPGIGAGAAPVVVSSAAALSTVADVVAKPPEPPAPVAPPQPVQAEEVILTAQLVEVPPTPTSATGGSVVDLALAGGVERHADDDLPTPKAKADRATPPQT